MAFWKILSEGKDFTTDTMVITSATVPSHLVGIGFVGQQEPKCQLLVLERIAVVHMPQAG